MTGGRTFTGFFSYAHIDAQADPILVDALTKTLETRVRTRLAIGEFTIWRDTDGLRTGDRWDSKIEAALRASDVLIVLLTPRWVGSDYCRKEFAIFEEGEPQRGEGEFIAPLLGRSVADEERHLTPDQKSIWERLKTRQFKSVTASEFLKLRDDERTALVDRLADDIKLIIDRRRSKLASAMAGIDPASPAHLEQIQSELSKANQEAERRHREMLAAIAQEKGVPRQQLEPILTTLGYENVPLEEMAERLRDAVDSLRAKAAEPLRPSDTGEEAEKAIRDARAELRGLNTGAAIAVLDKAMEEDEAFKAAARGRATLLMEKADIQHRSFDHSGSIVSLDEAVRLDHDRGSAWIALGDAHLIIGSLVSARAAFAGALAAAGRAGRERDEMVALLKIADVLRRQGDRTDALEAYRKSLAIAEALAANDPSNTTSQRDLSISHEKIGNVLQDKGDRAGALDAYRKALAIREVLAAKDPGNAEWQRDLSLSYEKIGDVLQGKGDRAGALDAYRKSLVIAEALVAKDPGNTQWQRDLSVGYNQIGDVLWDEGDPAGALETYRKGLVIREVLATKGPSNTEWQRDLSVSYNQIGDVLRHEGDRAGALGAYHKALAIAQALAAKDPSNTLWQRDLSISHNKISDVLRDKGDRTGALAGYRKALAITEALAAKDPSNTWWQRDLSISHNRIGDVLRDEGDRTGALGAYRKAFAAAEALAAKDPSNTLWRRDLSVTQNGIGDVLRDEGDRTGALEAYRKALTIAEALAAEDPGNTLWQQDLLISRSKIGDVLRGEAEHSGAAGT
jgi:tetratricopeptide (TPR) repeat protein